MDHDDVTDWERFSQGAVPDGDGSPRRFVFDVLAALILCAAGALMLAAVVSSFDWFGASLRDRAFVVAVDGGSALNAALVLGAVIVAVLGGQPDSPFRRRVMTCAVVASGFVLASALYIIAYAALAHPHFGADSSIAELRAVQAAADWSVRVQAMFVALASWLLAAGTVYLVRRARRVRKSVSPDLQPTP